MLGNMQNDAAKLEQLIRRGIPDADVRIEDIRGDAAYFSATVTAPSFQGLPPIDRHRMIYRALSTVGDIVECLQITTRAA